MKRVLLTVAMFFSAIVLALRGQQLFNTLPEPDPNGVYYFIVAVMLLLGMFWLSPQTFNEAEDWQREEAPLAQPITTDRQARWFLLFFTVVLSGIAFFQFANNMFTRLGVLAWVGAILNWWVAVGETPKIFGKIRSVFQSIRSQRTWQFNIQRHHILLLAIFAIGLFFRLYRLDGVPYEFGSDQAEKLLDVNDVLNGARRIFFPRNTGREAIQFYLTAGIIWLTPLELGYLALKLGTALVSIMALPFTYLLGKELYDRRLGLLALLFISFSGWHVAIGRVGLRFPFTPAFATPVLYFLIRALRYNKRNDWLLAGLFLGVGLHTYIPMRIVPLLLVILVVGKAGLDWWQLRFRPNVPLPEASGLQPSYWLNAVLSAVTSALLFLPLLRFMYDDPDIFWLRVTSRSSDALASETTASVWQIFWGNVKNAALMFNYRGDVVYANTVPFSPQLGLVTGALFILGLAYLLWRLVRCGDRRPLYLLTMLFVLVLPSVLSIAFPVENPSVVRTGGAIPIAMIMAGLPLWVFWQRAERGLGQIGVWIAGILTLTLTLLAINYNYDWYFNRYDAQYKESIWNSGEMADVVVGFDASVGDQLNAYHVAYPHWVDTRAIAIHTGDVNWQYNAILDLPNQIGIYEQNPNPQLFLLHLGDTENMTLLQATFPEGTLTRQRSDIAEHKDFMVFFVPERK